MGFKQKVKNLLPMSSITLEKRLKKLQKTVEKQNNDIELLTENAILYKVVIDSMVNGQKKISGQVSEILWSEIFNNAVSNSKWLSDMSFAPGRWAIGYPALYIIFKVLEAEKPKHILELGLGQSSKMIAQYAEGGKEVEHYVVEHDPVWIEFCKNDFSFGESTHLVKLDIEMTHFMDSEQVRHYKGFVDAFGKKNFDFIFIDAPLGGDMKEYARIDILDILPQCLLQTFVIMLDDFQRPAEKNTVKLLLKKLSDNGIAYCTKTYSGEKDILLITSPDNKFLTSM